MEFPIRESLKENYVFITTEKLSNMRVKMPIGFKKTKKRDVGCYQWVHRLNTS